MAKHIKMMLYGEPGVGKSVFASKAPRPFFITTDGNYDWLVDYGAKEEDHKQVYSWEEAKKLFEQPFDGYDTVVVDLVEDLFKWCEQEFCKRSKLEHISDLGYGKGYDITRNEFFLELSKLIGKPKNIILISHGITFTTKDRRGVEHFRHAPSSRIPDKLLDMIEGRMRYCLRCYLQAEEQPDGTLAKKRYLSLVPKENEFGIARGLDESVVPHDIPLDFATFAKAIGLDTTPDGTVAKEPIKVTVEQEQADDLADAKKQIEEVAPVKEISLEPQAEVVAKVDNNVANDEPPFEVEEKPEVAQTTPEVKVETVVETPVEKPVEQPKTEMSNADKIAAIKAKLAAMRNNNK